MLLRLLFPCTKVVPCELPWGCSSLEVPHSWLWPPCRGWAHAAWDPAGMSVLLPVPSAGGQQLPGRCCLLFLLCRVRTKPCALCASANLFTCRSYGIFKNEEEGLRLCLAFWDAAGAWVWSCVPGRVFWLLLQILFIQFYKILAGIKSTYQGVGFYESHGMWKSSWLDELWLHIPDKHNDSIYSDLAARTQIDSVGNKFSQPQNFSGNQPDPAQKKCMQGSRLGLQKYVRLLFHVCVPVS